MRVLVTGGAGFIGTNFVRYWHERYPADPIVNVDLLTYAGDRRNLEDLERDVPEYSFVRADITDAESITTALRASRPDVIVNFAAETHNSRAVADPQRFLRTNVLGTQVLLEAARGCAIERFHHVSTCEVYGDLPLESTDMFTEGSTYAPHTPYSASKAAADHMVRAYGHTFGMKVTISIASNNFGPWQHPEKLIPLFITNALRGEALPVYRSSAYRREWLHVADHCRAIEAILMNGRTGETYNVGSGAERSIDDVADAILDRMRLPRTLKRYVEERPGHDRRYRLDSAKITRELGWQPKVTFEDGLLATIGWYKSNEHWWSPKRERVIDEFAWHKALGTAARS